MKKLDYMQIAQQAMAQIGAGGAFLTVSGGEAVNTMTIGWGLIGIMWGKPMLTVAVRTSRHTFGIIDKAGDFTVSVPVTDKRKELAFCGSKSGRTFDKFKECGLVRKDGIRVKTPIIGIPAIHFECEIVFKAPMDPQFLRSDFSGLYPSKDYHTLYYGQIVECYSTEGE
jgi:flavin reductase (DIM6/NTAB) family NADH-FMN oxidoreductase RutF